LFIYDIHFEKNVDNPFLRLNPSPFTIFPDALFTVSEAIRIEKPSGSTAFKKFLATGFMEPMAGYPTRLFANGAVPGH
jgi:hypothetical protein